MNQFRGRKGRIGELFSDRKGGSESIFGGPAKFSDEYFQRIYGTYMGRVDVAALDESPQTRGEIVRKSGKVLIGVGDDDHIMLADSNFD